MEITIKLKIYITYFYVYFVIIVNETNLLFVSYPLDNVRVYLTHLSIFFFREDNDSFFFFFFFHLSTQEGGVRFELVTSALLGVIPAD
jgi:hypothetical protein